MTAAALEAPLASPGAPRRWRWLLAGVPLAATAAWALAQPRFAPWLVGFTLAVGALFALGLRLPSGRRGDAVMGGGLALAVAWLYWRTLSPTTDVGDSLEWVVIARDLSVGHGPGYPLYVLLGKAFQTLPMGDLAWRMNLLSATAGLVAVLLTYLFALRLTGTRLAALSGALMLAVSTAFWSLAVITEVYTLQVALVAAVLVCLERYTARARMADAGRWLALTAFVLGLALVQHLSNAFLVVVVALAVAHNTPRAAWRTRRLPVACLAFLLGLAPLVYFPIRWPAVYGRPVGFAELRGYLLGTDYRRLFFPERLVVDPSRLWLYRHELLDQYSVLAILIGVLGIAWLWRSRRQWAVWLGLLYTMFVGARLAYYVWDGWVIQTPAHLLLAVAIASGLAGAAQWLGAERPERPARAAAWWSAVAVLIAAALWSHGPRVDRSAGWPGYALARRALAEDLPQGAVLVPDPDLGAGLLYEQMVRGLRPDVAVRYGDTREGGAAVAQPEAAGGPVFLLDVPPDEGDRHPLRSLGPWVEMALAPWRAAPSDYTAPADRRVADAAVPVHLAGYRLDGDPGDALVPGTTRGVTLLWRADGVPAGDLAVQVALVGPDGRSFATAPRVPVSGRYPFTRWTTGEHVSDYHDLPLDWAMRPGAYDLAVSLVDPSGATRARWSRVAGLRVAPSEAQPPSQLPLRVTWRDAPTLVGCDGCWPVRAGEAVPLRLYWRAGPRGTDAALDVVVTGTDGASIRAVLPPLAPGQVLATDHPPTAGGTAPGSGRPRVSLERAGEPLPRTGWFGVRVPGSHFTLPGRKVIASPRGLPAVATFADGVALVDVGAPERVVPGHRAWLRLTWAARAAPGRRYKAFVHLLDEHNGRRAGTDREILHAARPTNAWRPGDELVDWVPVDIPADLPPGGYQFLVGLYDQADKDLLPPVDATGRPTDRRVLVPVLAVAPAPQALSVAVNARLGEQIALDGAGLGQDGVAAPGQDLPVTLRWRALADVTTDYTVFAHLVRAGALVAQTDSQPFNGALPTSAWPVGEVVDTPLTVSVPADAIPGAYELHVGLYDLASGLRLPVSGASPGAGADHVVIPVTVR